MRVLIATNRLDNFAGAETVAFEIAEYLLSQGHQVDVYANIAQSPMSDAFKEFLGITIKVIPHEIKPFHYDFIYFQSLTAPLFDYKHSDGEKQNSVFIFGRLSRRCFIDNGGWAHDNALGSRTIANSDLTRERLIQQKLIAHPISTFYNGAPSKFFTKPRPLPSSPSTILVVTNHQEPSLMGAIELLKSVAKVVHLGIYGDTSKKVLPEDIIWADLVISIGKTAQYALATHTPLYVYDHFGGPGYLNESNFESAALFSFTGRCCERKLSPIELFDDILSGYKEAAAFAQSDYLGAINRFRLEPYLDELLTITPSSNHARRKRLNEYHIQSKIERSLAYHLRSSLIGKPTIGYRLARLFARLMINQKRGGKFFYPAYESLKRYLLSFE